MKKASSPPSEASRNPDSPAPVPEEIRDTQPPPESEVAAPPEEAEQSPISVGSYS